MNLVIIKTNMEVIKCIGSATKTSSLIKRLILYGLTILSIDEPDNPHITPLMNAWTICLGKRLWRFL